MAGFVAPIIQGLTVLRENQAKAAAQEQARRDLVNLLITKFSDPNLLHQQLTRGMGEE